jgi:membrane associated rhomboid family serine protease
MFPMNDTEPSRYSWFPFMTVTIIVLNTLIYFGEPLYFPERFSMDWYWEFLMRFGFTPGLILQGQGAGVLSSLSSMFLHAGFSHWFFNMWAFWVFARRVEDACGPWRFLAFYLLAGFCADVAVTIVSGNSMRPGIGASGAIYGVMGAYLLLYPSGRIRTLILLIGILPTWPKIRAGWVVLYFVALQIIPALDILFNGTLYGVGYWAHLGGFLTAIFIFLFLRPEAFARYFSDALV